jgi:hypothetical protein
MKQIVCLYCEGSEAKIALLEKNDSGLKIERVVSVPFSQALHSAAALEKSPAFNSDEITSEISFDKDESESFSRYDSSDVGMLANSLTGVNMKKIEFVPVVTEPTVNFHPFEAPAETKKEKIIDLLRKDIQDTKGIALNQDVVDYIELKDKSLLGVFLEGDLPCVQLVNLLAHYYKRRFLKIAGIKPAELSLAYYVSKTTKFFPEDFSLIIYIGKEYSKLLFLEGQQLRHVGATLDIGTRNLHTYDVYFSKILLEMENGGIPKLDNIILCGEDRSENLILSFYGTFPEANVTELKFDNFDKSLLSDEVIANLSLYSIPLAVGVEYFDTLDKTTHGLSFLPKFIVENQKPFQFGWHGYVLLPFLFGATFFFTFKALSNIKQINELDTKITQMEAVKLKNQTLLDEIAPLEQRINSFDNTQVILDSAARGTEVWSKLLLKVGDFMETRRNFWITKLTTSGMEVSIEGYSLSRSVLTEFAEQFKNSTLQSITFDPIRKENAFSFKLKFKVETETPKNQ